MSTPDGGVPIAEIEVGDTVLTYNEETGEVGEYEVTHTFQHDDEVIVTLSIDGEIIETTPEHPCIPMWGVNSNFRACYVHKAMQL